MTATDPTTEAPVTTPAAAPGAGSVPAAPAPDARWEERALALWAQLDAMDDERFRSAVAALAGELPAGHPAGLFEQAAAWDSTGRSDRAVPLYARALDGGLTGERRRRAVIQMASSLRNLGRPEESVALLTAERDAADDHLNDAVSTVLALALADVGRAREGVAVAVAALAPHLPRYQRSMAHYARALTETSDH